MNIVLQDSTFRQLRDFIYEKSGIFIPDEKKYFIEHRLATRIQEANLNSYEDYLYLIKYSPDINELKRLFDAVVTNETFFFRDPNHFNAFFDFVVPEITKLVGTNNIKVWSAGCSTGEEPYTLVMIRNEKAPSVYLEVFASDISERVLNSAMKAVYNSYSVRNTPETYLKKYFKANDQVFELDHSVRTSVKFMNINLIDEKKMKIMNNMDVIFCRNVIIYFDDKVKQKVLASLYDSLRPGGFLFLGSAESLHNITKAFKPVIISKVVLYRKT